ncbi:MAG TPA: GxGYxYP family putative glycoside hydrolase [Victivallales bacterium]|nr:GxGYxYP family putative glycoside hydrolase [Victivallales bacterium]
MKKVFVVMLLSALFVSVNMFAGKENTKTEEFTSPDFFPIGNKIGAKFYAIDCTGMMDKHYDEVAMLTAIQGLMSKSDTPDRLYLYNAVDEWYLPPAEDIPFKETSDIEIYKQKNSLTGSKKLLDWIQSKNIADVEYKSVNYIIDLVQQSHLNYGIDGYFRYDSSNYNKALTFAGLKNAIPLTENMISTFNIDLSKMGNDYTTEYSSFKDLSVSDIFSKYNINKNIVLNIVDNLSFLKDYAVMTGAWIQKKSEGDNSLGTLLKDNYLADTPVSVFGWGNNEVESYLPNISSNGDLAVPSDWGMNFSTLSSTETIPEKAVFENAEKDIKDAKVYADRDTYNPDKKYITFLVSDGDNLQMWLNDLNDARWWGSSIRKDKNYPVGWTVPAAMYYMTPDIWNFLMDTANKKTDEFVIGPSGIGYNFGTVAATSKFTKQKTALKSFVNSSGLNIVTLFGKGNWENIGWMTGIADQNIDGGFYFGYPAWPPITSGVDIQWIGEKKDKPIMYANAYLSDKNGDTSDNTIDTSQQFLAVYVCKNNDDNPYSGYDITNLPAEKDFIGSHVMDLIDNEVTDLKNNHPEFVVVSPSEMISLLKQKETEK